MQVGFTTNIGIPKKSPSNFRVGLYLLLSDFAKYSNSPQTRADRPERFWHTSAYNKEVSCKFSGAASIQGLGGRGVRKEVGLVWDHLRLLTPTESRCRQRFSLKEEGLQNVIMQALLFSMKQDIESCSYPRCLKSDCLGTLANKHYGLCERVRSPRAGGTSPCMRSSWPRDSRIISSSHQQPRRNSCIRVKCGSTRAAIATRAGSSAEAGCEPARQPTPAAGKQHYNREKQPP